MAMHPSLLILDEPTSQLDPIAASDFLETVKKINRDIGTTVIITEHRLQDIIPFADKVFVMDQGKLITEGTPGEIGLELKRREHGMFLSMPVPMQIFASVDSNLACPLTVSDGRMWMQEYLNLHPEVVRGREIREAQAEETQNRKQGKNKKEKPAIEVKEVWFRYEKKTRMLSGICPFR